MELCVMETGITIIETVYYLNYSIVNQIELKVRKNICANIL